MAGSKTLLHVGCGPAGSRSLPPFLADGNWREIRLDIDSDLSPDICCSMTNMADVPDNAFDAVFSSHNLEHLCAHEVPLALTEFRRVLRKEGFALIAVPDIQSIAALAAQGDLQRQLYVSPAGPVRIIDILYGFTPSIAHGNRHMRHRTGFTAADLTTALTQAGFMQTYVLRREASYSLVALAHSGPCETPHAMPWWTV